MEQYIKIYRYHKSPINAGPLAATFGNFDGLHAGHQSILKKICAKAKDNQLKSTLISFYPHPAEVLGHVTKLQHITTVKQTAQLLKACGVDFLILINFTKAFSELSAADFIERVLIADLNVSQLVIGPDAHFGQGASGNTDTLKAAFSRSDRALEVVEFLQLDGKRVSSRSVRDLIAAGEVRQAASFLNRNYAFLGKVLSGDRRGRLIGFPTLNMKPRLGQLAPCAGVYLTSVELQSKSYKALTNIGMRPTFNGTDLRLETHLLDYNGADLYGRELEVQFLDRLRDEKRFDSQADLVAQIKKDVEKARTI